MDEQEKSRIAFLGEYDASEKLAIVTAGVNADFFKGIDAGLEALAQNDYSRVVVSEVRGAEPPDPTVGIIGRAKSVLGYEEKLLFVISHYTDTRGSENADSYRVAGSSFVVPCSDFFSEIEIFF